MSCCVFSNSENKIRAKCRKRQKHKKLGEWGDSHFPFSWFNASSGVCNCARQQEKAHTDDDWRLNLSHPLHNQTPALPLFFQYLKANKKKYEQKNETLHMLQKLACFHRSAMWLIMESLISRFCHYCSRGWKWSPFSRLSVAIGTLFEGHKV